MKSGNTFRREPEGGNVRGKKGLDRLQSKDTGAYHIGESHHF